MMATGYPRHQDIRVSWYSMTERVYLDWNATTPLRPEAKAAMADAWELEGNPSSVHAEGGDGGGGGRGGYPALGPCRGAACPPLGRRRSCGRGVGGGGGTPEPDLHV